MKAVLDLFWDDELRYLLHGDIHLRLTDDLAVIGCNPLKVLPFVHVHGLEDLAAYVERIAAPGQLVELFQHLVGGLLLFDLLALFGPEDEAEIGTGLSLEGHAGLTKEAVVVVDAEYKFLLDGLLDLGPIVGLEVALVGIDKVQHLQQEFLVGGPLGEMFL